MMLKAIYGGAFDPVHDGHLAVARAARDALDTDIALLPTGDPPHRTRAQASDKHRIAMLERALADEPRLSIDRREMTRQGRSYTIDTLEELRAELGPDTPLAMIVGEDAFAGFPSWQRWPELFDLAHIVVASRPQPAVLPRVLKDEMATRLRTQATALRCSPAGYVFRLPPIYYPQSSSAVRERCAAGLSLDGWVPDTVANYIAANGLYRAA